jgi:hypothetical protein
VNATEIDSILRDFRDLVARAATTAELDELRRNHLAKKSPIRAAMSGLRDVPAEQRAKQARYNELKGLITEGERATSSTIASSNGIIIFVLVGAQSKDAVVLRLVGLLDETRHVQSVVSRGGGALLHREVRPISILILILTIKSIH